MSLLIIRRARRFRTVRTSTEFSLAVVVAGLTYLTTRGVGDGSLPVLWADVNGLSRESALLVGPVLAGVGAWIGGHRHTIAIGPSPHRGWGTVARAQLLPLLSATAIGHVVGLLPALLLARREATGGTFASGSVIAGLAGLVAILCLSFLLGAAWNSRLAIIIAAVATYPVFVAPALLTDAVSGVDRGAPGASFYSVAWVWLDFGARAGQSETTAATVQRCVLFSSLACAAVMAAVALCTASTRERVLGAAAPFVVPIAIATFMLIEQPNLVQATGEVSCETVGESAVCLPTDLVAALPAISAGVRSIVDVAGLGALEESVASGTDISDVVSFPIGGSGDEAMRYDAMFATATAVAGLDACTARGPMSVDAADAGSQAGGLVSLVLAAAIAHRAGASDNEIEARFFIYDPELIDQLDNLSDAEFRGMIDRTAPLLTTCSASRGDLTQ